MLRNENFSAPGYHALCASQTQHSRPFVSTQPPLVHRQWSVDVPKAITIPLSVQTADSAWMSVEEQCPGYLWYSYHAHLALQFRISALCGCCAVGLLWYGVSGMCNHQLYLSIHNIHGQMHVDYQNGLYHHSQLSCHAICLFCSLVWGYAFAILLPYSNL